MPAAELRDWPSSLHAMVVRHISVSATTLRTIAARFLRRQGETWYTYDHDAWRAFSCGDFENICDSSKVRVGRNQALYDFLRNCPGIPLYTLADEHMPVAAMPWPQILHSASAENIAQTSAAAPQNTHEAPNWADFCLQPYLPVAQLRNYLTRDSQGQIWARYGHYYYRIFDSQMAGITVQTNFGAKITLEKHLSTHSFGLPETPKEYEDGHISVRMARVLFFYSWQYFLMSISSRVVEEEALRVMLAERCQRLPGNTFRYSATRAGSKPEEISLKAAAGNTNIWLARLTISVQVETLPVSLVQKKSLQEYLEEVFPSWPAAQETPKEEIVIAEEAPEPAASTYRVVPVVRSLLRVHSWESFKQTVQDRAVTEGQLRNWLAAHILFQDGKYLFTYRRERMVIDPTTVSLVCLEKRRRPPTSPSIFSDESVTLAALLEKWKKDLVLVPDLPLSPPVVMCPSGLMRPVVSFRKEVLNEQSPSEDRPITPERDLSLAEMRNTLEKQRQKLMPQLSAVKAFPL